MSKYPLILSILFLSFFCHSSAFSQWGVSHWIVRNGTSDKMHVIYRAWGCAGVDETVYEVPVILPDGKKTHYWAAVTLLTTCHSETLSSGGVSFYSFPSISSGRVVSVYSVGLPVCKEYDASEPFDITVTDSDIGYTKGPYTYKYVELIRHKCYQVGSYEQGGTLK